MSPFESFYNLTPSELSGGLILFNLFLTFILQLVIIYVYKKTRHGLSYSQSFIFTLIMVGVLGTTVMMAVQNNVIGAIAIFGAFTIIRFRSILKETSDLAYVFFALVIGISVGMGHYPLALITTGFLTTLIYLFYRFGFGSVSDNFDYLLIFTADKNFVLEEVNTFLDTHTVKREMLHAKYFDEDNKEFSLSLSLKNNSQPTAISEHFNAIRSIKSVEILTGKNTSEF
ncbi:DUF4956 domain-containing protein [Candidatus Pacebacteria bacterium]|nr:DUF4956 domain-containing protein [Candidatus Paceibacterota bacterium]